MLFNLEVLEVFLVENTQYAGNIRCSFDFLTVSCEHKPFLPNGLKRGTEQRLLHCSNYCLRVRDVEFAREMHLQAGIF